jgi:hypothetical protein
MLADALSSVLIHVVSAQINRNRQELERDVLRIATIRRSIQGPWINE